MKVCMTHNCQIRNNGTATFALRAMKEIGGVEAFHYMAPMEGKGEGKTPPEADMYVYVDDGVDHSQWLPPHPWAYWAIDTHLGYGYRLWKAKQADRVFVAQKDAAWKFRKDGVKHVEWLPLACMPAAHPTKQELIEKGWKPEDLSRTFDVSFVGYLNEGVGQGSNNRVAYLDRLFQEFPNSWCSVNVFFEDMAARFVRSKLVFNISIKKDLNMRVFEAMCTGSALLTNRDVHGIGDLFEEGKHYFGYKGRDEMVSVVQEALSNDALRHEVASSALIEVRTKHTYHHRMKTILEVMEGA